MIVLLLKIAALGVLEFLWLWAWASATEAEEAALSTGEPK
jgi:hypothetical protein